jgi:hypothetical protein
MSYTPFNIHKLNVQGANKQLANVGYTYKLVVFSTKLNKVVFNKSLPGLEDNLWT